MKTYKNFRDALSTVQTSSPTRVERHLLTDDDEPLPRIDPANARSLDEQIEAGEQRLTIIAKQLAELKARCALRKSFTDHTKDVLMLRQKGIEHQEWLLRVSRLRRQLRENKAQLEDWDDSRMFIKCAREILPKARYDEIWEAVLLKRKE